MPDGVIDVFEVIQIEIQQRTDFFTAFETIDLQLQRFFKKLAIQQSGKLIVGGLPLEFLFQPFAMGNVTKGDHGTLTLVLNG